MALQMAMPTGAIAPASWWEWVYSVYPLDRFMYNWQFYGTTVSVSGTSSSSVTGTGNLNIQVPSFCYRFTSKGYSSTGGSLSGIYNIGIALASSNDWTNGQWAAEMITGNGTQTIDNNFPVPREIPASTQLTVTCSNSVNTAAFTVQAGIMVIECRQRSEPIKRSFQLAQR